MEGPASRPVDAWSERVPLVGRHDVLRSLTDALEVSADGTFQFCAVLGEPGGGKTRLLSELAGSARGRAHTVAWGRAAEFEQEMPFGTVVDALDDHVEALAGELAGRLDPVALELLHTVFPALSTSSAEIDRRGDASARYRLYRTIRLLLDELAAKSPIVLILDDVHWADDSSIELLDHLVRHPPRGRVMIAVAYRPAQASPRLAALVESAGERGRQIMVRPLSEAEAAEFLGPQVSGSRRRLLYEASGGNPFYLEALVRMGQRGEPITDGEDSEDAGDLPPVVRTALRLELSGLSSPAQLVAQAAALAADEFEPGLAAVAAEVPVDVALDALNELVSRDVVRPVAGTGRFHFRHPLVRRAAYGSAAAGWRLAAHARIAAHLGALGASAIAAAHHVERSAEFGDQAAIATLVEAARSVAAQTPATAARWLAAALRLMPESETRLELLLELAKLQTVGGQLLAGRETAREVLRLLPRDDHERRVKAARFCAMIERLLDRPDESRALLLAELRALPDAGSPVAVPLRLRLVAENLMRVEYRAAQAILDSLPEDADGEEPAVALAIAALRPMPAYAAGRIADANRYIEVADRLMAAATDEQLAEWMDSVTWLCWAELLIGRQRTALRRFDRTLAVARATGQSYIVTSLLSGQARAYGMLGMLSEAAVAAEEAAEVARLLFSGQSLVIALAQQSLVASWSGDDAVALAHSEQAVHTGGNSGEWWAAQARYARAIALIRANKLDQGTRAAVEACGDLSSPQLDQTSLLSCCEEMAAVEMARGRADEAQIWATRAAEIAHPALEVNGALAALAQAHVLATTNPPAAVEHARMAALILAPDQPLDSGRARLRAAAAAAESGDRAGARDDLVAAADIFLKCGARTLHAQVVREQRRLGGRSAGSENRPYGLSPRELEVALLVANEYTNAQISEKLFIGVRTVETHLAHIFAKLGVASRVAVANALSRRD